jgi:hypothetical protein
MRNEYDTPTFNSSTHQTAEPAVDRKSPRKISAKPVPKRPERHQMAAAMEILTKSTELWELANKTQLVVLTSQLEKVIVCAFDICMTKKFKP